MHNKLLSYGPLITPRNEDVVEFHSSDDRVLDLERLILLPSQSIPQGSVKMYRYYKKDLMDSISQLTHFYERLEQSNDLAVADVQKNAYGLDASELTKRLEVMNGFRDILREEYLLDIAKFSKQHKKLPPKYRDIADRIFNGLGYKGNSFPAIRLIHGQ
jgi:hypothetical protein